MLLALADIGFACDHHAMRFQSRNAEMVVFVQVAEYAEQPARCADFRDIFAILQLFIGNKYPAFKRTFAGKCSMLA